MGLQLAMLFTLCPDHPMLCASTVLSELILIRFIVILKTTEHLLNLIQQEMQKIGLDCVNY